MSINRKSITENKNWNTPAEYVELIRKFFGGEIQLDPCSNSTSLVRAKTEYFDGALQKDWNAKTIFINPPYGNDKQNKTRIFHWIEKAARTHAEFNNEIILLIPTATNTRHWQNIIFKSAQNICFLKVPRLKFGINGNFDNKGAPMAISIVYFGNRADKFRQIFSEVGFCVDLIGEKSI